MDLGTLANVVTASAAVIALVVGTGQLLHLRAERRERAAFEIVHTLQTAEYIRSISVVFVLPDAAGPEAIEAHPEARHNVDAVLNTFEVLGYAVYCRLVPLQVVEDLVGGAVRVTWRKVAAYASRCRLESGSQKTWEWAQWLGEQLERRRGTLDGIEGAHVKHREWTP